MSDPWLEKFRKNVLPVISSIVHPDKVLIFGSRAKENAREESDIDIIIVSDYFSKMSFIQRMPFLLKKAPFEKHVDYLCYTPDEFEKVKKASSVLIDALSYAKAA